MTTTENPDFDIEYGLTVDDFIESVYAESSICYFHNLKFDGMFILSWLLIAGYTYIHGREASPKGTFKTLISDMGAFYSITVHWENGKTTEFRDSYKKLPMTVERIGKSFSGAEVKGDIDYHKVRPVGYQPTPEEWDYIRRDVVIVAHAVKETLDEGMTKLTVAGDALAEHKGLTGTTIFGRLFPVLSDDMDAEIRRAYRGGFTYAAKRFKGRETRSGIVLDVNSLYPSVMASKPLPYGEPQWVPGKVEPTLTHPLTIFSITFIATLKKDHIPCIQIKGSSRFVGTEYLENIDEPTTLMVTDVDLALYEAHYDLTILEYGGGWRFQASTGMFAPYIDKWSKIKEAATGGKREIAKLFLNSLYGRYALNPNVTSKYPVLKDGIVKLVKGDPETRDPLYTAVGVFITAYARDITIRAAQENYDTFAYADTDSLHLLRDTVPDNIDVHPTRMGAWKFEYAFDSAYYIRPKAYLERRHVSDHPKTCKPWCFETHYTNAIAGLPVKVTSKMTFADLVEGAQIRGKLKPRTVPGGVVLEDVSFELKLR